ncbi:hypothetical protein FOA43_003724 [Brettanomyces nanus]|uniref:Protein BCP1 n=1 Tax=Eeniella nana TaxID=13502 RepID=A0A875S5W1_EENNA|nr:uncharacterized protein FOA43_003724 [Brettanomyces nanus]QPG76338.1 hypothetical protein FOA43_003724 [Brettanomyces nanus]
MPKRTQKDIEREEHSESDISLSSSDDEELRDEVDTVNVDFDFFNLDPKADFSATKNFLRQLFQGDSLLFPLSEMADILLSTNQVGTTVKTDGKDSDPFSIISVTGLTDNLSKDPVKKLSQYLFEKTGKHPQFNAMLRQLLSPSSKRKLALIFSERLINMPVETAPPMYRMLMEEIDKAGFKYDYFLIPSRVYQMIDSEVDKELNDDGEDDCHKKRSKKNKEKISEFEYYHYEDEVLESHALHHAFFDYTKKGINPDARRVFNDYAVVPKLSLILIGKNSLETATQDMSEKFAA